MAQNQHINKVVFGSATLVDLTGTTATADKILTGYGAYGADGAWMDGTAEAGGGASNVVFGTFAGNTDGEKLAISTNYSGSGYPVALLIYSQGGVSSQAGVFYLKIKRDTTVPPKYVLFSNEDYGLLSFRKPSKTNTNFSVFLFYASGPSGNDNLSAVFTDNTTLGVCISNSNNLFVTGQTYSYVIVYSE